MKGNWIFIIQLLPFLIEGNIEDNYIGCYYDDVNDQSRPKKTSLQNNTTLTIEWCIGQCLLQSSTYAGLESSRECLCGDDFGANSPDTSCDSLCPGNKSEHCGGSNEQRTFYSIYAVCELGYYGSICDQVCHCKGQAPCNRMTGKCPNECEGKWSGATCNDILVSEKYIGCFRDNDTVRAISPDFTCGEQHRWTVESCSNACSLRNNSIVGLQASFCCFCGENYARYGPLSEHYCSDRCTGNQLQYCGGALANSVYFVCPAGYYGPKCHSQCRCYNNSRCGHLTGECKSTCKAGWTGDSCNVRDCKTENGDCSQNETCVTVNLNFATVTGCRCLPGFERKAFWEICRASLDTDECELGFCDASTTDCTNTIGSYNCICKPGYQHYNESSCYDTDECELGFCDASTADCTNTIGGYLCACKSGYRQYNETTCYDVDECSLKIHNCFDTTEECNNTIGSFFCVCKKGFQRKNDACEDVDVDECISSPCGDSDSNTRGSYYCNKLYSVGDVIGAAVGSAVGAAVLYTIILTVVIVYRRRQLEREHSEVANQIRHKDGTSETPVDPMPWREYETLGKHPNPNDSSYAELEFKSQ